MIIKIDKNLYLETAKLSDADEVFSLVEASRNSLREWLPWVDLTKTPEDIKNYFKSCIQRNEANNGFDLSINYKNQIVGLLGLHKIDHIHKATSIGYWLSTENEGLGLMTRSVEALCNYCFYTLDLNRIEIACATGNIKSQNIPKRLGFTWEETLINKEIVNGKYLDHHLYSLVKD